MRAPRLRFSQPALLVFLVHSATTHAQPWELNDLMFNPSGIPSLSFSQPRFADLDADGDFDLILGSIDEAPLYYVNDGGATTPSFHVGPDVFAAVSPLDAEVGVCVDLDCDGDLDFVTGGFSGLSLFDNLGDASAPLFQKVEGFFQGMTPGSNPVPTGADLDSDGDPDLILGLSEDGHLKLYPNSGTPDSAVFLESQSDLWFDVGLYAYPWCADLDNDGDYDLLAGRDATGFRYYRNTGDLATWEWESADPVFSGLAQTTYWNSPCLVDLSGDGTKDLVYGTAAGPLNYYVNTGSPSTPVWAAEPGPFGGVIDVGGASSPFLFDFDLDGDLDLVCGTQLGDIKYYENCGSAFAPAWEPGHDAFSSIDHSIYSSISLGDADGDALPDALVGDTSGRFFFHWNTGAGFVYDGALLAGVDLGYTSVPRLTDMDLDGDLDIVAGSEAGALFYFRNTGTLDSPEWVMVPGFFGDIDVGSYCSPTVGDLDNDGDLDLLTGDIFHEIQFFENVAGTWVEDPAAVEGISAGQNAAPAMGDLDGDGDLDLTIGNYDGTFNYYRNMILLDAAPPMPVADLAVAVAGHLLALEWSAVTTDTGGAPETVAYYTVYRGESAHFAPTAAESLAATFGTSFIDSSVSFSPAVSFFYLVRVVDQSGNQSGESNRVGEINLELLSGTQALRHDAGR
ncbi:MAG: VCBS repeat-containing protein [Candidatus Eisenbacteria bacterium]|nr:VCBS repeat-containing protein [Candidatus Eisenbacteria bacterium]